MASANIPPPYFDFLSDTNSLIKHTAQQHFVQFVLSTIE